MSRSSNTIYTRPIGINGETSGNMHIKYDQMRDKDREIDDIIQREFYRPVASISDVIDYDTTRYILSPDEMQIELFCQYYPDATPEESAININHSSMIIRPDKDSQKAFCIYGSGHLDTSQWDSYNNKEFDNERARYITFSVHNTTTLLIKTTSNLPEYISEKYFGKVECSKYSNNVYKLTVYGEALRGTPQVIYLPRECKILDIDIVQTSEKEHFCPYYPSTTEEGSKLSRTLIIITTIISVLLIAVLVLVIYVRKIKLICENRNDDYVRIV